jgi:hypothetical protein
MAMPSAMTDHEMLQRIHEAFRGVPRPAHFTNHTRCDECWEHDEVLRARDLETLAIEDVGSQAWNPITMATPQAFAYLLPALARLALDAMPKDWDWYGYIILFELRWDGPRNWRWQYCTRQQRAVVAAFLEYLFDTRSHDIAIYDCGHELMEALGIWSDTGDFPP